MEKTNTKKFDPEVEVIKELIKPAYHPEGTEETLEQYKFRVASAGGRQRWKNKTKAEKMAHSKMMTKIRQNKLKKVKKDMSQKWNQA